MIRESLNLSDSEDEAGSRRTTRKQEDAQTDCQVTVEGVSVRVLNQLRPVCLECTAPAVSAIVAACKRLTEEHAAAPAAPPKKKNKKCLKEAGQEKEAPDDEQAPAAPRAQPAKSSGAKAYSMGSLSAGIPSKVTWQPSALCWAVHFKEKCGKTKVTTVPALSPASPPKSLFGAAQRKNNSAQLASLREAAFLEACRKWNELDTSKRPRIELEEGAVF